MPSLWRGARLVIELKKKDLDNSSIGIKSSNSESAEGLGDILGWINKIDSTINQVGIILNKVQGLKERVQQPNPMQQTTQLRPVTREVSITPPKEAPEQQKKNEENHENEVQEVEMNKININPGGFIIFIDQMLEQVNTKPEMTVQELIEKFREEKTKKMLKFYLSANEKELLNALITVK